MQLSCNAVFRGSTGHEKFIVGISGASGPIYGIRLLEMLRGVDGVETHLVLSPAARRTITLEPDFSPERAEALADRVYRAADIAAAVSSGSFLATGMIVAPCSIKLQRRDDHATHQRH